jgi:hypothetical protein
MMIHYHRGIVEAAKKEYDERHRSSDSDTECSDEEGEGSSSGTRSENGVVSTNEDGRQDRLCSHSFSRPHRGEDDKLVVRCGVNSALVMSSVVLTVFVVVGCSLPSFSLDILGVIGVAVESGHDFEDATTYHSVFTILKLLIEEARFLDYTGGYIGLGTLSSLVLLTVFIVPIVQTLALMRHWFFPTGRKARARLSIFIEILQAWQYSEVYLFSVFIASW